MLQKYVLSEASVDSEYRPRLCYTHVQEIICNNPLSQALEFKDSRLFIKDSLEYSDFAGPFYFRFHLEIHPIFPEDLVFGLKSRMIGSQESY